MTCHFGHINRNYIYIFYAQRYIVTLEVIYIVFKTFHCPMSSKAHCDALAMNMKSISHGQFAVFTSVLKHCCNRVPFNVTKAKERKYYLINGARYVLYRYESDRVNDIALLISVRLLPVIFSDHSSYFGL